jgi:hypothetical protein
MKKFIAGLTFGVLISLSSAVFASDPIQALLFPAKFEFNGKTVVPGEEYTVLNYQGHAYVPIRFIAEQIGATIDYEAETRQIFVKNEALNVTDLDYPTVSVGNLILVKDGSNTKVTGQIRVAGTGMAENMIGASLFFYNDKSEKIGEAPILGSKYGEAIQQFEAVGSGDFRKYASVNLHIEAANYKIVGKSPAPYHYISKEAAFLEAKRMDPTADADWKAELIMAYNFEASVPGNRPIWKVSATYRPYGNKMIVYLDAVSGKQLALSEQEPPGI